MRDIFEFNHINKTLLESEVRILKDLYAYYHKKHYGYQKLIEEKTLFAIFPLAN